MRHIFLSYCHDDADFAQILDAKVHEAGFSTWRDLNLSAGDNWRSGIDDGIKDALAVVVIMSPSARLSPYVNFEWAFALGCGIPVLPVLLKLEPSSLHPRLAMIQYLDFSNYQLRPWEDLAKSLRDLADAQREFTLRVPRDAPPVIREAANALDSMECDRRRAALASLAQMNHPAAIELLAEAVRHPIQEVRFGAAFQLGGKRHDPRALPTLLEAEKCGGEGFRPWMISSIGEPAVPLLIETIREKRESSGDLIGVLGEIGGHTAVDALTGYLSDSDTAVRRSAAFALGSTQDQAAIPALRSAKKDADAEVRCGVASALGKCGGAAVVEDLIDLLHDSEANVRHQAVCCLDDICALKLPPPALEPAVPRLIAELIAALDDQNPQVLAFAGRSLEHLADPRAIPGLISAFGRQGAPTREIADALKALGKLAMPALHQAAGDSNELLRLRTVEFIARYGGDEDSACIAGILSDANPDVRLRAIEHIGFGLRQSPLLLEALIARLHDPEEDIAMAAIRALAQIGNPAVAPHLIECLKVDALAASAAHALETFDTREVRTALKAWSKSVNAKSKSIGGPDGLEG
jgi:HEAT repeat protein